MANKQFSSAAYADSKPHYTLLDGLRGAAALMVVWYHVFEGLAFSGQAPVIETFNHGYLAVDFFFMLSGFVISYAYDDRWNRLTIGGFFKRRLVRLHPMIVMGAIIGLISYLMSGGVMWDGTSVSGLNIFLAFLLTCFFMPAWPGSQTDLRGLGELYSLNGPMWSLFFEYIGNVCYALFVRRLSTKVLAGLTALLGLVYLWFALTDVSGYGMIGVGWGVGSMNFFGGLLRMMFPFSVGMLLARNFKPIKVRGVFWLAIVVLFGLFSVPYIPGTDALCVNGVYEMFCIMVAFPVIVWLGASGTTTDKTSTGVCKFLGDISYPLYIVHYPVMYLFYAWLIKNNLCTLSETWPVVVGVYASCVILAYAVLKLYDEPVRKWLVAKLKIGQKK